MFFERTLLPSQTDVFLRGDADGDRTLSIVDAIQTLRFLFEREGELLCLKAADSNDDGRLNVVDPIALVSELFGRGDGLPEPFAECGSDPTEDALGCRGPSSCHPYALLIRDTLDWSREHPNDWIKTWQLLEDKWNQRETCPSGAFRAFNIDAKINGAYIALGLLYGDKDVARTLEISTRCGKDSDCNPANACGILGVVLGYEAIPDEYKSGITAIADQKFKFTDFTFRTIVDSTVHRAVELAKRQGGQVDGENLTVRLETRRVQNIERKPSRCNHSVSKGLGGHSTIE